jgi:hypothetical protein
MKKDNSEHGHLEITDLKMVSNPCKKSCSGGRECTGQAGPRYREQLAALVGGALA